LSYITILGQAPAMEEKTDYFYKIDHHMRIKNLLNDVFAPLSGYLNAQDLLNLRQTCKSYLYKMDCFYLYYRCLYSFDKPNLLHIDNEKREFFKIHKKDLENLHGLSFVKKVSFIEKPIQGESYYQWPLIIRLCLSRAITFSIYYKFINND
jgi:hypothetical protein